MMINYQRLGLIAIIILVSFAHVGFARSEQKCGTQFLEPILDVTMPTGCMTSEIFKRQLDNPEDLRVPRKDAPADTARRLKALSDWRSGKAKSDNASEGQK